MKTFQLKAEVRESQGKRSSKQLRKQGLVPAVIYGGDNNLSLTVEEKDLRGLIYTPDIHLIEMSVDGKEMTCIIQDIQFHPVNDHVLHIDFLEVFEDKPIVIDVPVVLDGHAVGVRAGGKLSLDMRKIRVRALYNDIPERLHVNVTKLALGKTIQIGDLAFDKLELLNAKNAVVAAVRLTRASRSAASGEEAEEEGEEEGSEEATEESAE